MNNNENEKRSSEHMQLTNFKNTSIEHKDFNIRYKNNKSMNKKKIKCLTLTISRYQ